MARSITYREAINEALAQEMERDERVIVMGEDNAGGEGSPGEEDAWGGVLGVTKGLYGKFPGRVLDTPISESAFIGAAVGAATGGLRPGRRADVHRLHGRLLRPDLQPGRQVPVHVRRQGGHPGRHPHDVGRRACGRRPALAVAAPVFTHIPGLKVVVPSTPYDAKGLLIQSIRDDDPVIFFEHKMLYDIAGEVPEESYAIPFGEANIVREGGDVTIVAIGRMVNTALEAAERAGRRPGSRPRSSTRAPPARWTRTRSWSRSRTPAGWSWSTSPTRAARWPPTSRRSVAQEAFGALRAPIQMVTGPHTPVPFTDSLEDLFIPDARGSPTR